MKQLTLILLCASLVGCEGNTGNHSGNNESHIIKIRDCDYVVYSNNYNYAAIEHCGDCHNPIHLTTNN